MRSDFVENILNSQIEQDGYAIVPFASQEEIKEITAFYKSLPSVNAKGTYVTMFHPSYEYRKGVDEKIKQLFAARASGFLKNYKPLFANFMIKEPGTEGDFPLHQDWTYVDETRFSSYAFWVPMQDVNIDNGALNVVPGSHNLLRGLRGPGVFEAFSYLSDVIKTKYSKPISLQAGEALVWDHRLIHFSLPNRMDLPRLAFTLIMVPESAEVFHIISTDEKGIMVSKYTVDTDFYLTHKIGSPPENYDIVDTIQQMPQVITEELFHIRRDKQSSLYHEQSRRAADYYDKWQQRYNETYGDIIQAFRPASEEALISYLAESIKFKSGDKVLDAGCGIAGPAVRFTQRYDIDIFGVTISEIQVRQALELVEKSGLTKKIRIIQGDYHHLTDYFEQDSFDKILFLESLGHAGDPTKVISESFQILKPGGLIYIKDFYIKEPDDRYWRNRIQKTIDNIDRLYSYRTLKLTSTISALRAAGFEIEFIRKFAFQDDISVRFEFESRFGIDIFGGEAEFYPAEWLEIKCLKPVP